ARGRSAADVHRRSAGLGLRGDRPVEADDGDHRGRHRRTHKGERRRARARRAQPPYQRRVERARRQGPMSGTLQAFLDDYAEALRRHLDSPTTDTLAEGYELGRRALVESVSLLDLTEHHFRLATEAE